MQRCLPFFLSLALSPLACGTPNATSDSGTDAGDGSSVCAKFDGGPAVVVADGAIEAGVTDGGPIASPAAVQTLLERSCAFVSCHGTSSGADLYLPKNADDPSSPPKWWKSLVGVPANELPTMKRVAPGDPTHSWLIQKMEGAQCAFGAECLGGSCGTQMPQSSDLLAPEERDLFVRWVRQGASAP